MQHPFRVLGLTIVALLIAVPAFAPPPGGVPEIDPTVTVAGVTALVGGVLVLIGRRRK